MTTSPDAMQSMYVTLACEGGTKAELPQLAERFPKIDGLHSEDYPSGAARNGYRASFVVPALLAYTERVGDQELRTQIGDLLSDLMHLTDLLRDGNGEGVEFDEIVEQARRRYLEEVDGE